MRSPADVTGEFEFSAQAVVIASGGIGGNIELVRRNWPRAWGEPPVEMISGVPDFVDGSMIEVTERVGGRVINPDRMWHYPEGIVNHAPLWSHHGIRILPGPSSLWLDAVGRRFPAPLFPGFDALGALRHVTASGYAYSWFVLDTEIMGKEFGLSGSEQNGDLTGKDLGLLAGRLRPGPTPEVQAFADYGVDFLTADTVGELAAKMNQLVGEHLIDAEALRAVIEQRDLQVRSGLGKDPQVVAVAAARRFLGDRLMRIAPSARAPRSPPAGRGPGRVRRSAGRGAAARLTRKTLGGLETDLDGRVLRADGSPVPGVYAVGEAAGFGGGGMHGYRALEGTFLGGCLFTGRTAGRALAAASDRLRLSAQLPPAGRSTAPLAAPTERRSETAGWRWQRPGSMVADDLGDDEGEELLGELGVQLGLGGQGPESGDLLGLACRGRRAAVRTRP